MKNDIKWKKLIYLFIIFIITAIISVYIQINFPQVDKILIGAPKLLSEVLLNIIILYFFKKIVFDNLENYKNYKRNTKIFLYFIGSYIMGGLICFVLTKFLSLDDKRAVWLRDLYPLAISIMIIPLVISILISLKNRKKIWYRAMNIISSFFYFFQILTVVGCYFYYLISYTGTRQLKYYFNTFNNEYYKDAIISFLYGNLTIILILTIAMFFHLLSVNTYKYFKLKRSVKD